MNWLRYFNRKSLISFQYFISPFKGLNNLISAHQFRRVIIDVITHSGICSAIQCGISIESMTTWMVHNPILHNIEFESIVDLSAYVLPCYIFSFFISLQCMMSSLIVLYWVSSIPEENFPQLFNIYSNIIMISGWLQGPSLIALGAGLVCHVVTFFGPFCGVTAFCSYSLMGILISLQLTILARSSAVIRSKSVE